MGRVCRKQGTATALSVANVDDYAQIYSTQVTAFIGGPIRKENVQGSSLRVAGVRTVTPFQVLGQYLFSEKWEKHHAALGSVLRRQK
jgi:hypothetical protein